MSNQRIIPINIEEEMKSAYIDYSMSVIISRALPDVRDGLKPVHRRVLYGMQELGLGYNKSHRKSARIVGDVLGKFHPHGDSSVYDTMVRMAQWWSLRYPLVDGQGNFGSMDGDSPAAMRYTEARLRRIADELLSDIKKETVDFELNFDDSMEEPTVLPSKLPHLLVNGASGIAVGMATNMMPHNLTEVCKGVAATVDNPDITIDELMTFIKAPDFPTGGIIYGTTGVREAFHTGRGRIVLRARTEIEATASNRERIIVTEIPYQVNKARLVAKIAELVNTERVQGISDIRDESDRDGLRIVIDIKKDAMASVVLNMLFKHSDLQTSYGVNNVALVKGRPMTLNLKDLIEEFVEFRLEVIQRRTRFELRKAEERAHILEGLLIALDNLDEVIALIRASQTVDEARTGLMERFELSEIQSKAILDMRLQKLTGLEREKIQQEYQELMALIDDLKDILANETRQRSIIKGELDDIVEKFGDERRTDIVAADGEISIEDLIKEEDVVITISQLGYIKRTPVSEYRTQGRGGRGSRGSKTRDSDFIEHMFVASTHNYLLLFTESGQCHWLRVYEIPEAGKTSSGRVIQNILAIPKEDNIKAYIKIKDLTDEAFLNSNYIVFATAKGMIKKTSVEAFSRPRSNGIIAINIKEGDMLLEAKLTTGDSQILLANRSGYAIRFEEDRVRAMGRTAAGVRGMSLNGPDDAVIGMVCIDTSIDFGSILVISEKGNGKRTLVDEYRITNRGGKGVKTMQITEKTGNLVGLKYVYEEDDVMITTRGGITIRISAKDISQLGRATQGVRMVRLDGSDEIADLAVVRYSEEEAELLDEEE
jgi:DNA gyrase subunit A